jgi:hypothetical protein
VWRVVHFEYKSQAVATPSVLSMTRSQIVVEAPI